MRHDANLSARSEAVWHARRQVSAGALESLRRIAVLLTEGPGLVFGGK